MLRLRFRNQAYLWLLAGMVAGAPALAQDEFYDDAPVQKSPATTADEPQASQDPHAKVLRQSRRAGKRLRGHEAISTKQYGWAERLVDLLTGNTPPLLYEELTLHHPDGKYQVRYSKQEKALIRTGSPMITGAVLDNSDGKLHILWENGSMDSYTCTNPGYYLSINDAETARKMTQEQGQPLTGQPGNFRIQWRDVAGKEQSVSYTEILLQINGSPCPARLSMGHRLLVPLPPQSGWAKVLLHANGKLHILWQNQKDAAYERREDGVYVPAE